MRGKPSYSRPAFTGNLSGGAVPLPTALYTADLHANLHANGYGYCDRNTDFDGHRYSDTYRYNNSNGIGHACFYQYTNINPDAHTAVRPRPRPRRCDP